jgi:hypothetical protein
MVKDNNKNIINILINHIENIFDNKLISIDTFDVRQDYNFNDKICLVHHLEDPITLYLVGRNDVLIMEREIDKINLGTIEREIKVAKLEYKLGKVEEP